MLSQCFLVVVLAATKMFMSEDENAFNKSPFAKTNGQKINLTLMILAIISLAMLTFSSDILTNINSNINNETLLTGFERSTSLIYLLLIDLIAITYLVYVTNGPTLSPFTSIYSLIPVFALFLRLNSDVVIIFTILTVFSIVMMHLVAFHKRKVKHVQQMADLTCNVLSLGVAVWIGVATRAL